MARRLTATRRRGAPAFAAIVLAALLGAGLAAATGTPNPGGTPKAAHAQKAAAITDDNVAARVVAARTKADHEALAAYFKAKAASEDARIAHYDQLFRAYMQLKGKEVEAMQRHARALLKAARMSQQRDLLLGAAHRNMAFENAD